MIDKLANWAIAVMAGVVVSALVLVGMGLFGRVCYELLAYGWGAL